MLLENCYVLNNKRTASLRDKLNKTCETHLQARQLAAALCEISLIFSVKLQIPEPMSRLIPTAVIVLSCCLWTAAVFAQPIDSLRQLASSSETDTFRQKAVLALCHAYHDDGHDSTLQVCRLAIELSQQLDDPEAAARARISLGAWFSRRNEHAAASVQYHTVLKYAVSKDMLELKAAIFNNLALLHRRAYTPDSAYYYWIEAEKAYKAAGIESEIWKAYIGLFSLFQEEGDTAQANTYAELSNEYVSLSASRPDRGYVLFLVMQYYFQTEQFEQMGRYRDKWEAYQAEKRTSWESLQHPSHIALYMYSQNEGENVEPQLWRAIDYFEQMGNDYRAGWCYEDLGQLYHKRGQEQAAQDALTKAARYFRQSQNPMREGRVLQSLYQWSRAEGNAEAALEYLEAYRHIEDSLRRVDVENNLNALRVKAETEKKEQALQIKELELAQKTQERNLLLFGILLLALLAALVFWGLRQRLRANRQLAAQQQQIQQQRIQQLEQEAQLSSLQSMIEGQERERLRVANDLHDSLGGVITAAQNHFANLLARTPQKTQNGLEQRTGELLEHAGQELRRISQNLMPRSLTLLGLEGALEDLAGQLREQGINGQFQSIGLTQRLSEEQAVPLFRIAQELVNNVLKHAQASEVLLQLLQRDGQLFLTVEDNGRGFDLEQAQQKASLGMSSVESRVAYLKGEIDIDTGTGQGTSITIAIPL